MTPATPHSIILYYHRIADEQLDPHRLMVRPDRFDAQVRCVCERADVVSLGELRAPARRPQVALTFDDGYVDNLVNAKPILEAYGVTATVFVAAGMLGSSVGFWWDRLASLMLSGEMPGRHLILEHDGTELVMDVGTPAARERAHEFLHRRLMHEPSTAAIDELLLAVARAIDRQPEVPREALPMTDDELRMLATGGTVSIGCHTLSHLMLSQLDAEQQRTELEESQAALQRSLGRTVPWFAYPYGHPSSYNDATLATARELFDLAATTRAGPAERADPHQLPRYLVGDWKAEELAARLDQWLGPAADPKR